MCIFAFAAIATPFVTHADYSWVRNTLGELAGRQMPNAWIMRVGYVSLGFGIFFDALLLIVASKKRGILPFLVFGLCLIGVGVSNFRVFDPTNLFAAPFAHSRGMFLIGATMALICGVVWHVYRTTDALHQRLSYGLIGLLVGAFPLFLLLPQYAGLIDRVVLFCSVIWMVFCFGKEN